MSDPNARRQVEQSLSTMARRLLSLLQQLAVAKSGEAVTMPYIRERIQAAGQLVNALVDADLRVAPYDQLQELTGEIGKLANVAQALTALSPGVRNEDYERQAMLLSENVCRLALPLVGYIASKDRGALKALEAEIEKRRDEAVKLTSDLQAKVDATEGMSERAAHALGEIQKSAGEVGVSTHASEFSTLATTHVSAANRWLIGTLGASALMVVALILLVSRYPLDGDAKAGVIVQYVLTRAVAFAALSFVAVWASRNYRAHRHLAVLNQHRHKALLTFQTFVAASKDDATKNAVLLEATRCIFSAGSTGYAGGEADPSPTQFIEIVKSFAGKP